uniref:RRM domain-containing protein n=1 Tax=Tanacetum cinerariifolium TaxID=118510 RepID=A0A6L2JTA0_TANCI|nr:hypothetical protein [Tanacetum cinerariifolium]
MITPWKLIPCFKILNQPEQVILNACAIARSIFVTNFPDSTSSKDLWKLCQSYGTVVNVYILNHRSKAGKRPSQPVRKATHTGNTFASVVKGNLVSPMSSSPALVLDDTCLEDRDYENCVMGEILQFSSISNLRILLFHGGFLSLRTVYLGGL